ncbi:MAG: hypothetical protein KF744_16335 [Taibaiella sp.]|nr:hypothetical protein [Taibaiella sp.]
MESIHGRGSGVDYANSLLLFRLEVRVRILQIELPVNLANGTYIFGYATDEGQLAWFSVILNR